MESVVEVESDQDDNYLVEDENAFVTAVDTRKIVITQHNVDGYINSALEKMISTIENYPNTKCTHIDRLAPYIKKYGLDSKQIDQLLDIIFYQQNISSAKTKQRISLLLPRTTVPEKQILRIYGNLSCREYDPDVMQALLNWVVSIYDFIDGKEHISKMYCVLFYYLNLEKLRPQICHLLFLMTKKVHAKSYRFRFLVELGDKTIDPYIGMLLKLFHSFCPTFEIPERYIRSKRRAFSCIDSAFEVRLMELRKLWDGDNTPVSSEEFDQVQMDDRPKKQRRVTLENMDAKGAVSNEFDSNQILAYVERESVPAQIVGAFDNRMIQHAIVCKPNDVVISRICDILTQQLMNTLYWNRQTSTSYKTLENILHKILKLARLTKSHIPVVETFLARHLRSWNGIDCMNEIFELLTYIKPNSFYEIFESYLKPLNRLYCISDVRWKAKLILCYRDWLKHWALLDWNRHAERRKATLDEGITNGVDDLTWLFQGLSFNVDYFGAMQQMIYHVDRLCVQGLTLEQDHPLLQHASLSFFEFTASISLQHDIPMIIIPAASLVYRSFFSSNAMAVSRICGILHKYKLSFEKNDRQVDDWMEKNGEESMENFNTYVMDICNCLWRNVAFDYQSESTTAFSLSVDTIKEFHKLCEERGDALHLLFSLTHSNAFVGYSKHFMKLKVEEMGQCQLNDPVTVDSVKVLVDEDGVSMSYIDYRVDYLDYLKDLGFHGVYDLLYACMASLIERRRMEGKSDDNKSTTSMEI